MNKWLLLSFGLIGWYIMNNKTNIPWHWDNEPEQASEEFYHELQNETVFNDGMDPDYDLIKRFEGFSPTAYLDSAGLSTIGYGHLIKAGEYFTSIDENEAAALLAKDTDTAVNAVKKLVSVPLTQNQYNALVSFVYNIGTGAFKDSTLLKKLNAGDYLGAAAEFMRWKYAGGQIVQGLVNRREQEKEVFLS